MGEFDKKLNKYKEATRMTDEQLNDWLAINIMKWVKVENGFWGKYVDGDLSNFWIQSGYWDPSSNLEHLFMLYDKIDNMKYISSLIYITKYIGNVWTSFVNATARQRSEALYMSFVS